MKKKLGLVLGRFQPLHYGHVNLMQLAAQENDIIVVCIGSAQKQDPLPIEERHRRVIEQLKTLEVPDYRIIDLIDPQPISIWPSYTKQVCKITDETDNTFYRSDADMSSEQLKELEQIGFHVKICRRITFPYRAPNGVYYVVNSATDIKRIHKTLGLEKLL